MTPIPGKILYITDKFKVSRGYEPAFTKLLARAGIKRGQVILSNIYDIVDTPLIKRANENTWRFNPERKREIAQAFLQRVEVVKPQLIVVSDPAVLGFLVDWDRNRATLAKCRGGVYHLAGIPVIVVYPVTVIHTHVDESLVHGEDDDNTQQPYRVKSGAWILQRDWEKVGRYLHGINRRIPNFTYSVCRTIEDCLAARAWLDTCCAISPDVETGCFPPQITCAGYTGLRPDGTCRTFVIPFYDQFKEGGVHWDSSEDHAIAYSIVRDINASPILKIFQNGPYDSAYSIRDRAPYSHYLIDCMFLWYAMYMELPKDLDFIASILLDNYQYWKDDIKGVDPSKTGAGKHDVKLQTNMETYWRYNALDTYNTMFSALYMLRLLPDNPSMVVNYHDVFMRAMTALRMSMKGVKADFKRRAEHEQELAAQRDKNQFRLRRILGEPEFNINSPQQKCELLYTVFGLPERTARGRYVDSSKPRKGKNAPSAGKWPLKIAKTEHPLFRYIIEIMEEAMEANKQISDICHMRLYTDRFRTSYGAAGTKTTRLNSSGSAFWDGGNAQNITDGSARIKSMRDWLVADPGCVLFDVDYSQSDDVFIAYESQDANKMKLIESGLDGHAVHGELFFKWPYDKIVAGKKANDPVIVDQNTGVRQLSKKIVHGTNFRMMALTLYMQMGREAVVAAAQYLGFEDAEKWPQEKLVNLCGRLMRAYRERYPRLTPKEWYSELDQTLKTTGTLINCFNITRRFLGDPEDSGTQREATAFMAQSATAGNINRSMYEFDHGFIPSVFRDGPNPDAKDQPRKMSLESHGFEMLLQTHDSLTIQLHLDHPRWREAAYNTLYVMNRPVIIHGRSVRVRTEAAIGTRWGHEPMVPWDGKDPYDLDRIAFTKLQEAA